MAESKLNPFSVILLAAGKGTRMKSALPKVMHPVSGQPMIKRIILEFKSLGPKEIRVVLGHGRELIEPLVEQLGAGVNIQDQQKGTGHAVMCAHPETLSGTVVIANGDHPLVSAKDIGLLLREHQESGRDLTVVSCKLKKPGSYGRIVRQKGTLKAIVEAKDASKETLAINEVNTGLYFVESKLLAELVQRLSHGNAQGEYYLTQIVELAIADNKSVDAVLGSERLAQGVNSQWELAQVTGMLNRKKVVDAMTAGAIVLDPKTVYIEEDVQIGESVVIYPGVHLKGKTTLGARVIVGPNCWISDSQIDSDVHVKMGCHIEQSVVRSGSALGPYAHLRPHSNIGKNCRIGNFVETKNVNLGEGVKASHLTYLGDADIGAETNIGCGTITCNYAADHKKYRTTIGTGVFVGSDTQFVAPVTVGDGAVIGSGSTITKDVPAKALAVARAKQFVKQNYKS